MAWWRKLLAALGLLRVSGAPPLCDSCRYDYGGACKRPERPNAYRCPDYKAR